MHTNRTQGYWPNVDWEDCQERAMTAVHDYPLAIGLATFGIGIALGAAVGLLLSENALPARNPTLSEKTWDAMSQYLPEAVMRKIRV